MSKMTMTSLLIGAVAALLLGAPVEQAQAAPCVVPTATQFPPDCHYISPPNSTLIVDGLPPGSTISGDLDLHGFLNIVEGPGGALGGNTQTWQATLHMHLFGTGGMSGYMRDLDMPISFGATDTAPHNPLDPVQSFNTLLQGLQGQLPPGDPDFDLLRITAGGLFGMPSPGHTTLVQDGSNWAVDSFFDIIYRIDFVGNPNSEFAGRSGSTTGTIRLATEAFVEAPEPGSLAVIGFGLAAMGWARRKRTA